MRGEYAVRVDLEQSLADCSAQQALEQPDVRLAVDAYSRDCLTPLAFVTRDGKTWAIQAIAPPSST